MWYMKNKNIIKRKYLVYKNIYYNVINEKWIVAKRETFNLYVTFQLKSSK